MDNTSHNLSKKSIDVLSNSEGNDKDAKSETRPPIEVDMETIKQSFGQTMSKHPLKLDSKGIDKDIVKVRKLLTESYNDLITARDALSTISFQGAQDKLKTDNLLLTDEELDTLITGQPIDQCFDKVDKEMQKRIVSSSRKIEPIPEFQVFFRAVRVLRQKLSSIRKGEIALTKLENVISKNIDANSENTQRIKSLLVDSVSLEDIQSAEMLVDSEMLSAMK